MLRYLYGDELSRFPTLAQTMFRDRGKQFVHRHGWDVTVNKHGEERDDYDDENPLYVIWETETGAHGGSMRFLPTTGRTMIADHFLDLTDGVSITSPFIWECTRYCLAPGSGTRVAAALMLGGLELGLGQGLSHAVGVFDAPMCRIYRRLGWEPTLLGTRGEGRDAISAALWEFDAERRPGLLRRAQVASDLSLAWYMQAFRKMPRIRQV